MKENNSQNLNNNEQIASTETANNALNAQTPNTLAKPETALLAEKVGLQSGSAMSEKAESKNYNAEFLKNAFNGFSDKLYSKLPKWMKKVVDFVSREWLYFAVTILIFALFFGVLYSMEIFPFGSDNMSNYDLLAQIVPFYEHFYDVLEGKEPLFYASNIAGGADVFGTLAYCAVSPFTFIFLFFGKTTVYNAISIVLPLKLSCVACSAIYYIKKHFKNISEYVVLIMSIAFAFCGYMFVANTYINWVDFLIYMPFVLTGFEKLCKEQKIRYFAISYALMIYACFSIACFALFLIFIIFLAYVFIVCKKEERWSLLAKMCYALLLAIALALPLLVPSLVAYLKSGRNTGLFENMNNALSAEHLYSKMTYILADSAFLALTIIYFVKNRLKSSFDTFLFVTAIILMLPVLIDEVCNLMNAGSYMSYSLRFGFLNSTYALYVSARLLNGAEEKVVNKRKNVVFTSVFAVLGIVAIAFILKINDIIVNSDGTENAIFDDFSGQFAHSVGGLEVIFQIAIVVIALIFIGALLYKFKLASLKSISFVMLCVVSVQVAFYNIHLVRGNSFNPLRYNQYKAIFEQVDTYDDRQYYKVKDNTATTTADSALNMHTSSYAVFSSVIDRTNFVATDLFGYEGNGINSVECMGGTFFGDSLLGYKYYFVHLDDTDTNHTKYSPVNRDYLAKLEDTAQANFCAYENTAVFPNCYTVSSGDLKMDTNDYCGNMQELYSFIGGDGELYVNVDYSVKIPFALNSLNVYTDETTGEKVYSFQLDTAYNGNYYFDCNFPEGYKVGYSTSTYSDKLGLDYSNEITSDIDLGYSKANAGFFHFSIRSLGGLPLTDEIVESCVKGKILANETVVALSQKLQTKKCDYTKIRNGFKINATAENDSTYVLINYVAIDGYSATVNGKKTEVIDNGIKFLLVKLDEGENTVYVEYHSPYYKYIAVGLALGIIIAVAIWLVLKKFPKISKKIQPAVCVLALVLGIGIFAFFYCYPIGVFAKKVVQLIIA